MKKLSIPLTLFATLLIASKLHAQTADGFVKIGGDRREIHFARAAEVPDDLDKTKKMIHVVLSEAEIPSTALFDGMGLFEIRSAKKNQIVELNFRGGGVNWYLAGKGMEGMLSLSRSPNPFPYEILAGAIKGKVEDKSDGTNSYEISVTYSAPLEKPVLDSPPTPADALAAAKHPATKAYLNLQDAIAKGDKARIMASVREEQRSKIDTPDFPKMLEMIQMMQAKNLQVLKVVETDGDATLTLKGVQDGKALIGEARMTSKDGKWLMVSESWRN